MPASANPRSRLPTFATCAAHRIQHGRDVGVDRLRRAPSRRPSKHGRVGLVDEQLGWQLCAHHGFVDFLEGPAADVVHKVALAQYAEGEEAVVVPADKLEVLADNLPQDVGEWLEALRPMM